MAFGLQVFNGGGGTVFDSTQATGGVCLGIHSIPAGTNGGSYDILFPDFTFANGVHVLATGRGAPVTNYTADLALGYLRVTFTQYSVGYGVVIFAV